ncbi:MAG: thioredoxin domain-containing protein [Candidatus Thermoplasmatota archaeon]|nr:thioredoxin domain-containing protein [Candidatus Thermoplasmatota archaeon]
MSASKKHTNLLVNSTSPYLLQHAHNPVDWYPWSQEALDLAKEQNKPILLSVGYSACHWCHVMEKESFENEDTAKLMNEFYVNIKVDREERPDVDEAYMSATQVMNQGQGGWPMTVFLTPDLKPFFAGTYFPPKDAYGRPGFPTLLSSLSEMWHKDQEKLVSQADTIVNHLNSANSEKSKVNSNISDNALSHWNSNFDKRWGGFGQAPKFPNSGAILHLLNDYSVTGNQISLYSAVKTLDSMFQGGIYDHVGGGFARYSVDEKWLVPHFEKMLYDNAQLMEAYLVGYQLTKNENYLTVISQILEWLKDEMIDNEGGFYSSMDADSEGVEGKYYVWNPEEIEGVLSENDAKIFNQYYDISKTGNWEGNSIPNVIMKKSSLSTLLKIPESEISSSLEKSRLTIKEHRKSRVAPGTDDKIIVSWNGLMISSLAKVSAFLDDKEYFEIADRAVSFIVDKMSKEDGSLNRVYRDNLSHIGAFAEDYSYFGNALIDMYEASFDSKYLELSKKYADILVDKFFNDGYFKQSLSKNMVINSVNSMDNATPSYNFTSSLLLIRLHYYFGNENYRQIVETSMEKAGTYINKYPHAHSTAIFVSRYLSEGPHEIALSSVNGDNSLLKVVREKYLPCKIIGELSSQLDIPLLKGKNPIAGKSTVYICKNYTCHEPITDISSLLNQLPIQVGPSD